MKYGVEIPITGFVYIEVEAENESAAKDKAMQADITIDDVEAWDTLEVITEGNVFYGDLNRIEITEIGD